MTSLAEDGTHSREEAEELAKAIEESAKMATQSKDVASRLGEEDDPELAWALAESLSKEDDWELAWALAESLSKEKPLHLAGQDNAGDAFMDEAAQVQAAIAMSQLEQELLEAARKESLRDELGVQEESAGQRNETEEPDGRHSKATLNDALARRKPKGSQQKLRVVKLIALGAPGVGKSFLLDVIKGTHVFKHEMQSAPVTLDAEYAVTEADGSVFVLCNVPGLETDGPRQDSNARCIEEAFHLLEDQPHLEVLTAVIFVIGGVGGRFGREAVQAHEATMRYLGQRCPAAALIANAVDSSRVRVESFKEEMQREGARLLGESLPICLIEEVEEPAERDNLNGKRMKQLRQQIMPLVKDLVKKATRVLPQEEHFQTAEQLEREENRRKREEEERQLEQERVEHEKKMQAVREASELLHECIGTATYDATATSNYWGDPNLRGRQTQNFQNMQKCLTLLVIDPIPTQEVEQLLDGCIGIAQYDGHTTSSYWGDPNLRNRQESVLQRLQKCKTLMQQLK